MFSNKQPDPSLLALKLTLLWDGKPLAKGTGFVVAHGSDKYLVTNRHNLAGRHPITNQILSSYGVTPDAVSILHLDTGREREMWEEHVEPVVDTEERPLWYEHPRLGPQVDVVALKLPQSDLLTLTAYDISTPNEDPVLWVGEDLFVLGFPFAEAYHLGMGIWTRASVASEPSVFYNGLPRYLVDARTRKGQSGSPVLFRPGIRPIRFTSGETKMAAMEDYYLAGVYSGRIGEKTDIGFVWQTSLIPEIILGQQRYSADGKASAEDLRRGGPGPSRQSTLNPKGLGL